MKKTTITLMLALVLPMVAWSQTVVWDATNSEFKYIFSTIEEAEFAFVEDAQGKKWTDLEFDDSSWNTSTFNWNIFRDIANNPPSSDNTMYIRVPFTLSEVKDGVSYFTSMYTTGLLGTSLSQGQLRINGHFVDKQEGTPCDHFYFPSSYLKVGTNILTISCMDCQSLGIVEGIYYYNNEFTDVSAFNDAIYMDAIETKPDRDFDVQIKLKNSKDVGSYQFKIDLTNPFDIIMDSFTLNEERHDGHTVTENGLFFAVTSLDGGTVSGNDGTIMTLKLHANDLNKRTIPVTISDAVYAQPDGTRVKMPNVTIPLTIKEFKGDANLDDNITVADVVAIINNIVGKENDEFYWRNADYNNDGYTDIADVQTVLNIVLNRNNARQAKDESISDPQ